MTATIRLTVLTGPHQGSRFCLRGSNACLVGRASECQVRFCGLDRDLCISRRHCQLYFEPPLLRMEDLGSVNATYVNGHKVGDEDGATGGDLLDLPLGIARHGDILTIGGTSMQVNVVDCPLTAQEADDGSPAWNEKDIVKVDCPVACLAQKNR